MKNLKISTMAILIPLAAVMLLAAAPAFYAPTTPATPVLAAKKEMVRKQREQRMTNESRKAAAATFKAERIKIHQARQEAKQAVPPANDKKQSKE